MVTMGLDLLPDGLTVKPVTAGLSGHCQLDKIISMVSERKRNDLYVCFKRNNFTSWMILRSNVV